MKLGFSEAVLFSGIVVNLLNLAVVVFVMVLDGFCVI